MLAQIVERRSIWSEKLLEAHYWCSRFGLGELETRSGFINCVRDVRIRISIFLPQELRVGIFTPTLL
jgi:hypothetical protein